MRIRLLLSCLLLAALSACGNDPDSGDTDTRVPDRDASADATDTVEEDTQPDVAVDVPPTDTVPSDVAADTVADATTDVPDVPTVPAEEIVLPGAEQLPSQFAAAGVPTDGGPTVLYPEDGTLMPLNVLPAVFQWTGGAGSSYRFTLTTPSRAHHVYATDWKWQPEQAFWDRLILESRGEPVRLEVAELSGGTVSVGPAVSLMFSAQAVGGAVYYWAPSAGGIVRLPVDEVEPEPFLTPGTLPCVGCHALSPDGSRLAYTIAAGPPNLGTLGVMGTDENREQFIDPQAGMQIFYPSFSPDNVHLAGTRGANVVVLNTDTGSVTETLPSPEGTSATHPAWSPRGNEIVFAAGSPGQDFTLGAANAGLARVQRGPDGEWREPTWLVENGDAGGAPENLFYPAFSPDSRWVVFNRATTAVAAGGSPHGSQIWVVPSFGGDAVAMTNANGPDGTTNSWPKWAPSGDDGTLWVAFTSSRPYGRIGAGGTEAGQIWIAGIRPNAVAPGEDPSFSAYWMPGQNPGDSNHVAYWTEYEKD